METKPTPSEITECIRLSRASSAILEQYTRGVFATPQLSQSALEYVIENLQSALAILIQHY